MHMSTAGEKVSVAERDCDMTVAEALADKKRVIQAERQYLHDPKNDTATELKEKISNKRMTHNASTSKMKGDYEEEIHLHQEEAAQVKINLKALTPKMKGDCDDAIQLHQEKAAKTKTNL